MFDSIRVLNSIMTGCRLVEGEDGDGDGMEVIISLSHCLWAFWDGCIHWPILNK